METVLALFFFHHWSGQEISQQRFAANRTAAGTAAAMGSGEGLVQVQMHNIKAHITGPGDPHNRIQVCAVIIV